MYREGGLGSRGGGVGGLGSRGGGVGAVNRILPITFISFLKWIKTVHQSLELGTNVMRPVSHLNQHSYLDISLEVVLLGSGRCLQPSLQLLQNCVGFKGHIRPPVCSLVKCLVGLCGRILLALAAGGMADMAGCKGKEGRGRLTHLLVHTFS